VVDLTVLGLRLDSIIFKVFSNLNDSVFLLDLTCQVCPGQGVLVKIPGN